MPKEERVLFFAGMTCGKNVDNREIHPIVELLMA